MDIKELMKAVIPIQQMPNPMGMPNQQPPVVKTKKLEMNPELMTEAQKIFQPGGERKAGSPIGGNPPEKGTAAKMEPKGWSGKVTP